MHFCIKTLFIYLLAYKLSIYLSPPDSLYRCILRGIDVSSATLCIVIFSRKLGWNWVKNTLSLTGSDHFHFVFVTKRTKTYEVFSSKPLFFIAKHCTVHSLFQIILILVSLAQTGLSFIFLHKHLYKFSKFLKDSVMDSWTDFSLV